MPVRRGQRGAALNNRHHREFPAPYWRQRDLAVLFKSLATLRTDARLFRDVTNCAARPRLAPSPRVGALGEPVYLALSCAQKSFMLSIKSREMVSFRNDVEIVIR